MSLVSEITTSTTPPASRPNFSPGSTRDSSSSVRTPFTSPYASSPQDPQRKHYQPATAQQAEFLSFKTSKKSYREAMTDGAQKG
jgi:hypothetical protein